MQGAQGEARGLEPHPAGGRRAGGAPQQIGVVLGEPKRRAAGDGCPRSACGRFGARSRVLRAAARAQDESRSKRQSREQPEVPQTAETCSSSATRKEEPQPQAATTFGLETLNPAPC